MQKSDGVVVVRGVAVVVGAPPPLKGPRGGAHSREVSNTVPSPSYLRTRLWPRGPCSPCVPKGTVAPPPCPPAAPPPRGQKSPGQRDRYRKYSTRTRSVSNPPPLSMPRHHHHPPVTTTIAQPMQCVSTTPQRRGGGQRDRASTRPGLRDARRGYIESSRLPPPNHTRPVVHLCSCRRSVFRLPSPSPAPSAPAILPQSQAAKSLVPSPTPTPTPSDITHHGTSDGPRQHELEEEERDKGKINN